MGVIKRGILGGFSGKVANVVGSSWKGKAVIKSLPLSVANPKTAAQTGQRTKFSAVVARASFLLTGVVKPMWDRFAQQESGYNAFVSSNIDAYNTSGVLTPADLIISNGTLTLAPIDTVSGAAAQADVQIDWTDNSGTGTALATDEACAVVWNATTDEWVVSSLQEARNEAGVAITMSTNLASSDVIHAWLAFRRADGTLVSITSYDTYTVS